MRVSLKRAGEDRKAENQEFQAAVADQRAVVNILNKVPELSKHIMWHTQEKRSLDNNVTWKGRRKQERKRGRRKSQTQEAQTEVEYRMIGVVFILMR